MTDKPVHLDLFSGIGMFSLVAQIVGFETAGYCEIEPYPQAVLRKNFGKDIWIHDDITTLTGELIRERGIGRVDLLTGGFPCQDLSLAGKGAGITGKRSGLWFQMLRVIRACLPAWVVVENSPGLRLLGADIVLAGLEEAGYACWPLVVGVENAGGPHQRKRVIILAYHNGKRGDAGTERAGRETRSDARRGSAGSELDDIDCSGSEDCTCCTATKQGCHRTNNRLPFTSSSDVPDIDSLHDDQCRHGASEVCRQRPAPTELSGSQGKLEHADRQRFEKQWIDLSAETKQSSSESTSQDVSDTDGLRIFGRRKLEEIANASGGQTETERDCPPSETGRCTCLRRRYGQFEPGMVRDVYGNSYRLDRPHWTARRGLEPFENEPPRTTGGKVAYRPERIEGLGNAVSPIVIYPILKLIYEMIVSGTNEK